MLSLVEEENRCRTCGHLEAEHAPSCTGKQWTVGTVIFTPCYCRHFEGRRDA